MKIELSSNDGHHTFVEFSDVQAPEGMKVLRFTTVFDRARVVHERPAYELFLTEESLDKIRELLK